MLNILLRQSAVNFYERLVILTIALLSSITSFGANYIIDSAQTNVRFALDNLKTSGTTGGFYNVNGKLQYSPNLKTGAISLIIPIKSLDTGSKAFNLKLAGADFFDMQRYPLARFESSQWYFDKKSDSKVTRVDGNLTLHGETHPISLKALSFDCYVSSVLKKDICSGKFTATIDRTQWNINKYTLFGMTKNLTLNIQVTAIEQ